MQNSNMQAKKEKKTQKQAQRTGICMSAGGTA